MNNNPTEQKGVSTWVKTHKKQLIVIGVSIVTITVSVLVLKNKDSIKGVWSNLSKEMKKAEMYTPKWFETVSDEVLDLEREKVRLEYCSSGRDFSKATRLQNLLWRFDKEMSKRAWENETPHPPRINREHGWYLPNVD